MTIGGAMAGAALRRAAPRRRVVPRHAAMAFDAFPVFDPRAVVVAAEAVVPGRGRELADAWRVRQFEYQWLRALGGRYVDFPRATADALTFAARALRIELDADQRARLLMAQTELRAWPDALPALQALNQAGVRLALVSNATKRMLDDGIRRSGLDGLFEHVLSTDLLRTYKPDPRAYRMAVEAFGLPASQIGFAAFAGWDVAGAAWFGYPTYWVNRLQSPAEQLGAEPEAVVGALSDLVPLVVGPRR